MRSTSSVRAYYRGDWNDGMNRVGIAGRGESVWLGWFLVTTMRSFASVCAAKGMTGDSELWTARAASLGRAIEASAWDGAWYVRAFHDDGSVLGASTSRECSIDSIAQSWAVLSRAAADDRAAKAMDSAERRLVREDDRLVLLLTPPFETLAHDPGYIRAYPPGVRENGGQYTHAATWVGVAHAARGDGDRAERIFRLLNPVLRATTRDEAARYAVEPYVLAGDVYGAAPRVGRGGWTWYTGAAAWAWRLGVERILGLQREGSELRIAPVIPAAWPGFEAWVRSGEETLHVVVTNPSRRGRGVTDVTLDGARVPSGRVPLSGRPGTREVRVVLGESGLGTDPERPPADGDG